MTDLEKLEFLRKEGTGCHLYYRDQVGKYDRFEWKFNVQENWDCVYFYHSKGFYNSVVLPRSADESSRRCRESNMGGLLCTMSKIVRIEKCIDGVFYPIWTEVDGFIETDYSHFIKIKNYYYSIKSIENLIDEVVDLKRIVSKLNIY